jgi:hypothetical protein
MWLMVFSWQFVGHQNWVYSVLFLNLEQTGFQRRQTALLGVLMRLLMKWANGALFVGLQNWEYFARLGVLQVLPCTVVMVLIGHQHLQSLVFGCVVLCGVQKLVWLSLLETMEIV